MLARAVRAFVELERHVYVVGANQAEVTRLAGIIKDMVPAGTLVGKPPISFINKRGFLKVISAADPCFDYRTGYYHLTYVDHYVYEKRIHKLEQELADRKRTASAT